ncbi:MAG TPA: ATP-binding protein [Bacteroidota bacterium]|nr:ATP-binding protein [Bacteroidota bacterium]
MNILKFIRTRVLQSIRFKLTFWFTLIVGATLFAFGVASYFFTQEKLFASLDYSLRNEVVWLKDFIEPQAKKVKLKRRRVKVPVLIPAAPAASPAERKAAEKKTDGKKQPAERTVEVVETDSTAFDEIWNQIYEHTLLSPKKQIIQIRDRNDEILYRSYSLGKEEIFFEDIPYGTIKVVTIYNAKGQPLRLAVTQSPVAKIYVAYPESEVFEVLSNLFSLFIIMVPVSLLISVLGGFFLAKASLQPVDVITQTARDITAQNLDQRIPHRGVNDELGRLASTFNDMIERLQHSFDQIQQFSIDASHELRTPLTIMRGEIEMALRAQQTSDEYRLVLSSTLDEIMRMSSIIDNLLTLAKADVGQDTLNLEPLSLSAIIKELYEDSAILAEPKNICVILQRLDDISMLGDDVRLHQMLLNLVSNAIKYTPEDGEVRLSLTQDDGFAIIQVSDTGIGIPKENLSRIFDRFYRVDKSRSREMGGTGLGLSIAKWAAEAHGGEILVESEIGIGSTFTVLLPIVERTTELMPDAEPLSGEPASPSSASAEGDHL